MLCYIIIVLLYLLGVTLPQKSCVRVPFCNMRHASHRRSVSLMSCWRYTWLRRTRQHYDSSQFRSYFKTVGFCTNGRKWVCSPFYPLLPSGILRLEWAYGTNNFSVQKNTYRLEHCLTQVAVLAP